MPNPVAGKAYQVNVTDEANVKKQVYDIVKEFNGRLDIFVANSGIPWTQGPAIDGEIAHYHKVVSTDLDRSAFNAHAASRRIASRWRRSHAVITSTKLTMLVAASFVEAWSRRMELEPLGPAAAISRHVDRR